MHKLRARQGASTRAHQTVGDPGHLDLVRVHRGVRDQDARVLDPLGLVDTKLLVQQEALPRDDGATEMLCGAPATRSIGRKTTATTTNLVKVRVAKLATQFLDDLDGFQITSTLPPAPPPPHPQWRNGETRWPAAVADSGHAP